MNWSKIRYLSLEKATALPTEGFWHVYADRWWCVDSKKGLMFWDKSPQCNLNESLARKVQAQLYPDAEVQFIERVYLKHECRDYV